jgi:hypothetical protein
MLVKQKQVLIVPHKITVTDKDLVLLIIFVNVIKDGLVLLVKPEYIIVHY